MFILVVSLERQIMFGAEDFLRLMLKDFSSRWIKKGEVYAYLRQKLPLISEAKKK